MLVKSLVETKARVGVFSIALGAYLPQFPSLVPEFEAQYEAFKKTIPDTVELLSPSRTAFSPCEETFSAVGEIVNTTGFATA